MRQMAKQSGAVVNFSYYSTFEPFAVVLTKFNSYEWNINLFRKFIGGLRMSAVCKMWLHPTFFGIVALFIWPCFMRCWMNFFHLSCHVDVRSLREKNFLPLCVYELCQYNFIMRTQMKQQQKELDGINRRKPWLKTHEENEPNTHTKHKSSNSNSNRTKS